MGESEKRSERRKAVALRIKLRYNDIETFIAKFATNVSQAGLFIRSKKPKDVGTIIQFELLLGDGTSVVKGRGEVRWTRPFDPKNPRGYYGMGIAFTGLSDASREMVDRIASTRANESGFEPDRIPHRLPTAEPIADKDDEASSSSANTASPGDDETANDRPSATSRRPLQPEARKRPRPTLDEVLARADSSFSPAAAASVALEDEVSVASALKRARQLADAPGETDKVLEELEAGGGVVKATPREASAKLAALFGDAPIAATRRSSRDQAAALTDPTPTGPFPEGSEVRGESDGEDRAATAAHTGIASPAARNAAHAAAVALPDEETAVGDPPVSSAAPIALDNLDNLDNEPEPITQPINVPDDRPMVAAADVELEIGDEDILTSVDESPASALIAALAEDDEDEHEMGLMGDEPDSGSFDNQLFDMHTVARPDLAAALADAGEVLAARAKREAKKASNETSNDLDIDVQFEDPTQMAPSRSQLIADRDRLDAELDDDIEAALDALIPDDLISSGKPPPRRNQADLEVGDHVGFHQIPPARASETDDELFPPIAETASTIAQDDYVISFQPDAAESTSPEPEATFARAQAAIDEVIGEFDGAAGRPESGEIIDLGDHLELDQAGADIAPTFITDVPSAALASDLVHDRDNRIGAEIDATLSLDQLLEPEEPFVDAPAGPADGDGPVHGVGDFFDPQPLSEEVPLQGLANKKPVGPPPIPRPPPVPVRALARPPSTIPPGDLLEDSGLLIRAPGMPLHPEDNIDIDVSLDEFDESPAVVTGLPIPTAVADDEDGSAPAAEDEDDADAQKKKGLFGRLFRKT